MAGETILIVDDEKEIRNLIHIYLKNEGFKTLRAENGHEAFKLLKTNNDVKLIILDIMLPDIDGIDFCMKVREKKNVPIIMLSAKSQDSDKIAGLSAGADDYVTKPFNPLELIARVKSQLRRYMNLNDSNYNNCPKEIVIDDLHINKDTHLVRVSDKEIKLTPMEFDILELLAENRGTVFSIQKIYETVWKEPFFESDNTVMVHIRKIREKIEKDSRNPRFIKTVWGVGYKIEN